MGHFSMKISAPTGSILGGTQHFGQIEQILNFSWREIVQRQNAFAVQIAGHQMASRLIGQLMQWPPPRPRPSSEPSMVMTSIPALRSKVLV